MTEPQPAVPPPPPPFQFRLRTLLLLFVVLGSSLAVFGTWGILVFGLAVGFAVHLQRAKSLRVAGWATAAFLCLICCCECLVPLPPAIMDHLSSYGCAESLKRIAAALRAYHQENGCFPPACVTDREGKPTHSWRVLILPRLDLNSLYEEYSLAEAWDGLNNIQVAAPCPMIYACRADPSHRWRNSLETSYVAVVGANTAWANMSNRVLAVDMANHLSTSVILILTVSVMSVD